MVSDQSTPDLFKGTPDGDYYFRTCLAERSRSHSSPAIHDPKPVTHHLFSLDPITHVSPRNLEPPRQPALEHDHDQQESTANEVLPIRIELKRALTALEIQRHEDQSQQ